MERGILSRHDTLFQGDIIRIRAGDFVPADVELLKGEELEIDQSTLTGESLPVSKKIGDKLYSGSIVRKGECNAKVIATGKRAYYGNTTKLVSVAKPKLHMEEVIAKIVNYLLLIVVVLLGVMFLFSYLRREDLLNVISLAWCW